MMLFTTDLDDKGRWLPIRPTRTASILGGVVADLHSAIGARQPVTVILPVRNDERNMPAALDSIRWADEVWVVDSHSTDRTAEIAAAYNAHVVQFDYPGYGPKKKNWALDNLPFRNEWVLMLNADERMPAKLVDEVRLAIARNRADGYFLDREHVFLQRPLRWLGPNWSLRLFKHRLGRYESLEVDAPNIGDTEVDDHVKVPGPVGYLRSPLIHEDRRPISACIESQNQTSDCLAQLYRKFRHEPSRLVDVVCGTAAQRRKALRHVWVRLPFRPLARFLLLYVVRRGFLDGMEGFMYSVLMGFHEFMICLKLSEFARRGGSDVDRAIQSPVISRHALGGMLMRKMSRTQSLDANSVPVSILILATKNNAGLHAALKAVDWGGDIWVMGSNAHDAVVNVAALNGARFVEPPNPGNQLENIVWGLQHLPHGHEWMLTLTDTERIPQDLASEIVGAVARDDGCAYLVAVQEAFLGREPRSLRRSWELRLFKHRLVSFEQRPALVPLIGDVEFSERILLPGPARRFRTPILRDGDRTIQQWIDEKNYQSNLDAQLYREFRQQPLHAAGLFSRDRVLRTRTLKRLWVRLPLRPLGRFLLQYLVRGDLLAGRAGLLHSIFMAYYEFLISVRVREFFSATRRSKRAAKRRHAKVQEHLSH
jgi:glycosyltransferase involved in cell wall biosynthesis